MDLKALQHETRKDPNATDKAIVDTESARPTIRPELAAA